MTDTELQSFLEQYVTQTELSSNGYLTSIPSNYATKDYVDDKIDDIETLGPAAVEEITQQILSSAGYVTQYQINQAGYLTSIPSEYVTDTELQSTLEPYVTQTELSANGYLTSIPSNYATKTYVADYVAQNAPTPDLRSYVTKNELNAAGYITSADLPAMPTIDESIIPNTTNTYTLGDSSHLYSATYVSNIKFTGDGRSSISATNSTTLRLAPDDVGFYLEKNGFRPGTNGNKLLGTSSAQWGYTYSANFIENGTNIKDIYASKMEINAAGYLTSANFQYDSATNTLTITV